ncbi:hypothetical protein ACSSWA_01280 [Melioribacter sp. Ez-97]|uniref:hypothetical protein n=1 Tax=Melioribacter sp. Ez-97 TaxID=3423434 RepID=UPI003ED86745
MLVSITNHLDEAIVNHLSEVIAAEYSGANDIALEGLSIAAIDSLGVAVNHLYLEGDSIEQTLSAIGITRDRLLNMEVDNSIMNEADDIITNHLGESITASIWESYLNNFSSIEITRDKILGALSSAHIEDVAEDIRYKLLEAVSDIAMSDNTEITRDRLLESMSKSGIEDISAIFRAIAWFDCIIAKFKEN